MRECKWGTCDSTTLTEYQSTQSFHPTIYNAKPAEENLIRAAWSFLRENIDIVAWAYCHMTGGTDAKFLGQRELNELLEMIAGHEFVYVRMSSLNTGGSGMAINKLFGLATGVYLGNGVHLSRPGIARYTNTWNSSVDASRCCAAISLSALLLHELSHLAGLNTISDTVDDLPWNEPCYGTYMIESIYLWAMAKRYRLDGDDYMGTFYDNYGDDCNFGESQNVDPIAKGLQRAREWASRKLGELLTWLERKWNQLQRWIGDSADWLVDSLRSIIEFILGPDHHGSSGCSNEICTACPELCGYNGCDRNRPPYTAEELESCAERLMTSINDANAPGTEGYAGP